MSRTIVPKLLLWGLGMLFVAVAFVTLAVLAEFLANAVWAAEPSPPRPITITASAQEVQQLAAMLEQYGRACAAFLPMQNCATVPLAWEQKLQQAADAANRPPEPPPTGDQPK